MKFDIYMPQRILFQQGAFSLLGGIAGQYMQRCFVVCYNSAVSDGLMDALAKQNPALSFVVMSDVCAEPSPQSVDAAVKRAKKSGCDGVIGIGGGSVIDTAKAVAGLVTNGGSAEDYLEGVGRGLQITKKPLPFIAVPTTSGTGAEATKNAVLSSMEKKYKKSMRSEKLLPLVALVDPVLTVGLPPQVTAACGMDAITQLIESYVSIKSNVLTDALCTAGLQRAASLTDAYANGTNLQAREDMALCSLFSGIALANSGLGAAHGFAAGLGAVKGISHGLACAVMLPHVMRYNLSAKPERFAAIGEWLCQKRFDAPDIAAQAGINKIVQMNNAMNIPCDLKFLSITQLELEEIVRASMGGSMSGNPIPINEQIAKDFLLTLI